MVLTLPEEFLLLALRDDTGKPMVDSTKFRLALAGAAIVELALNEELVVTGEGRKATLAATGGRPADPRLAEVLEKADGRKPKDAISKVSGANSWRGQPNSLRDAYLADLVAAGVLREEQRKAMGLFPTTAWMPGDPAVEAAVLERVRAVAVLGTDPDERTAALVSILHAVGMLPKLFPEADRKALKRRGKELGEGDWAGEAVRKAVQEVQAATVAVIIASTSAATAAST